jgi:hypothetical protein
MLKKGESLEPFYTIEPCPGLGRQTHPNALGHLFGCSWVIGAKQGYKKGYMNSVNRGYDDSYHYLSDKEPKSELKRKLGELEDCDYDES